MHQIGKSTTLGDSCSWSVCDSKVCRKQVHAPVKVVHLLERVGDINNTILKTRLRAEGCQKVSILLWQE